MTGLAGFLTDIGSIFTAIVGFFGSILDLYTTNPVMAIVFTMGILSFVAAIGQRMVNRA